MTQDWLNETIEDVREHGVNYLYSLIYDYEKYVIEFQDNTTTVNKFIQRWTCIPYSKFKNLEPGDLVFDAFGNKLIVTNYPQELDESSEEFDMYVQASLIDSSYVETYTNGSLYSEEYVHENYRWRKIKRQEGEERICPILITKTSQQQS